MHRHMQKKEYSIEIGGKTLTAEFSDLAERANGSVILKLGDTVVLATAVMSSKEKEGMNWFPLTVDYEEKFYAAGQILGSRFMRREGRPSDEAVLTGRVVDRTIRPLFDHSMRREVQVVTTVLSIDEDDPDVLAVTGASLALATSDIPWAGPASAVRIVKKRDSDEFLVNPTYDNRIEDGVELEVVACGKDGNINMIEAVAAEVSDDVINAALALASKEIERLQEFQKNIVAEIGKTKAQIEKKEISTQAIELFEKEIALKLKNNLSIGPGNTHFYDIKDEWVSLYKAEFPDDNVQLADDYFEHTLDAALHTMAIEEGKRADGRPMDAVRDIYTEAGGISTTLHGSGTFYRGGTHVLSVLTLGSPSDSQLIEGMETQTKKRYMHHYNFPPFSVGEVGRMGMNRRMVGHGALAEKALLAVLPPVEEFPYTIRVVSESMASNGSTSMASVCGSTLALMDAGVPITAPVAGIAMGLMMKDESTYKILTDIQGPEDHHGDMDFKVAGTRRGVTAIQMDIKVDGIPVAILAEALKDAEAARIHILDKIEAVLERPRADISPHAPKILSTHVKPDQIGLIIGPGGKTVNAIREETGTEIDIEDDGTVFITGKADAPEKAKLIIEDMTREYAAGDRFTGEVIKLFDFGAVVKFSRTGEGLVHVSELAPFRVDNVADVVSIGEQVPVIIKEVGAGGKLSLSIKGADPEFAEKKGVKPSTRPPMNNGKNHRPHGENRNRRHDR